MVGAGLLITFLGFVFSVMSLGITASVSARMAIVLFGVMVSLFGIVGMVAPAYVKRAIWRKM